MKKIVQALVVTFVALAMLSGCATNRDNGALIGAGLGAALGSTMGKGNGRLVMVALGTMAGATVGSNIGSRMDDVDRMKANNALENTRTGVAASWNNPDTKTSYEVTPTRTYTVAEKPCRDFVIDGRVDGRQKLQPIHGKACRESDGTWRMQGWPLPSWESAPRFVRGFFYGRNP